MTNISGFWFVISKNTASVNYKLLPYDVCLKEYSPLVGQKYENYSKPKLIFAHKLIQIK